MIQVRDLTKRYGPTTAIDRVGFEVRAGEVLGFLGPNGAGKTTTMRIVTGFVPPTSGSVVVAGYDVLDQPLDAKRRIGYLPETPPVYPELTVLEYLRFTARIKGVPRRAVSAGVDRVLGQCGLGDVRGRLIGNLSKGYRQRVGLAQALIHDPPVLILDEPTVGLDPKQIIEVRELIRGLGGAHTVILSTHILPEVTATCQRVVIINEGRIVAVDTHEGLAARLRKSEKIRVTLLRPGPDVEDVIRKLPNVVGVSADHAEGAEGRSWLVESDLGHDVREALARCAVTREWGLVELRPMGMSLEDVFLKLTAEDATT
ncbi:MAG TPA: ATP-binding cassette domain-containing protein [Nitrospiria bacterium]|nr:ATP-binding cassette domain-containing protein [Nitrospiria bacterium]